MKKLLVFMAVFLLLSAFLVLCLWVEGINLWHRGEGQGTVLFVAVLLVGLIASFFSHGPGFDI